MAAELDIHPAALDELASTISWYRNRSEIAVQRFVSSVDDAVAHIQTAPDRWPVGEHGIRKFVLQNYPYAIFYRFASVRLTILAVAHGHRRPGYWRSRL